MHVTYKVDRNCLSIPCVNRAGSQDSVISLVTRPGAGKLANALVSCTGTTLACFTGTVLCDLPIE